MQNTAPLQQLAAGGLGRTTASSPRLPASGRVRSESISAPQCTHGTHATQGFGAFSVQLGPWDTGGSLDIPTSSAWEATLVQHDPAWQISSMCRASAQQFPADLPQQEVPLQQPWPHTYHESNCVCNKTSFSQGPHITFTGTV